MWSTVLSNHLVKNRHQLPPTSSPYLLFDANMGQLSSVKLNQRLNKIFDKKVGAPPAAAAAAGITHGSYSTDVSVVFPRRTN